MAVTRNCLSEVEGKYSPQKTFVYLVHMTQMIQVGSNLKASFLWFSLYGTRNYSTRGRGMKTIKSPT